MSKGFLLLLGFALFSTNIHAGRSLRTPGFYIHGADWRVGPGGFFGDLSVSCTNLGSNAQNVGVTLDDSTVWVAIAVANAVGLTGYIASGGVYSRTQNNIFDQVTATQKLNSAGTAGSTAQWSLAKSCFWRASGFDCSAGATSQFNTALRGACGTMSNCVFSANVTGKFSLKIDVSEDIGAITCALSSRLALPGAALHDDLMQNSLLNNGRPF